MLPSVNFSVRDFAAPHSVAPYLVVSLARARFSSSGITDARARSGGCFRGFW